MNCCVPFTFTVAFCGATAIEVSVWFTVTATLDCAVLFDASLMTTVNV